MYIHANLDEYVCMSVHMYLATCKEYVYVLHVNNKNKNNKNNNNNSNNNNNNVSTCLYM